MEGLLEEEVEEWLWSSEEDDVEDQAPLVPGLGPAGPDPGLPLQGEDVFLDLAPQVLAQGGGPGEWGCEPGALSLSVAEDIEEPGHSPSPVFDSDESPPPPYESPPLFVLLPDEEEDEVEVGGVATPPVFGLGESPSRDYEGPQSYFPVNRGSCLCMYCRQLEDDALDLLMSWLNVVLEEEEEEEERGRGSGELCCPSSPSPNLEVVDMELCGPSSSPSPELPLSAVDSPPPSPPSHVTSLIGSSPETESSYLSD
ncbi:hypothetical protein ABVT39_017970 [Epinephelus coioides]